METSVKSNMFHMKHMHGAYRMQSFDDNLEHSKCFSNNLWDGAEKELA